MENKKQTFSIESLKEKHKVSEAVFEGTKAAEGWRKGRCVTEAVFLQAVKRFEMSAVSGREGAKG